MKAWRLSIKILSGSLICPNKLLKLFLIWQQPTMTENILQSGISLSVLFYPPYLDNPLFWGNIQLPFSGITVGKSKAYNGN